MLNDRKPRILVVEDELQVRGSIIGYLTDLGMETLAAVNGNDALQLFIDARPDVVLLDLRMPGLDGMQVLKAIREQVPDAAVIIISGKGMMEDAIQSLRLGAWDYLVKPIRDLEVLGHSIRKALERIRILQENREYREHLEEQVKRRTAQLETANHTLEAKNIALREVLASIESERRKFGQQVHVHVEKAILPTLRSLGHGLTRPQQRLVNQIEQGLNEILSPFIDKVSRDVAALTPTELRVCSFINRGLAVKEIAELEHLSPETVAAHRRNIRRKLGIANRKVNLTAYLRTVFDNQPDEKLV